MRRAVLPHGQKEERTNWDVTAALMTTMPKRQLLTASGRLSEALSCKVQKHKKSIRPKAAPDPPEDTPEQLPPGPVLHPWGRWDAGHQEDAVSRAESLPQNTWSSWDAHHNIRYLQLSSEWLLLDGRGEQ